MPIGWRRHQICYEFLIGWLCLISLFSLFVQLLLHKREELTHWHIFEVSIAGSNEPVVNFFKSILFSLLVGNIIAAVALFVELRQWIGGLLEAIFQTIQMNICATPLSLLGVDRRMCVLRLSIECGLLAELILGSKNLLELVTRLHWLNHKFEVWEILK